LVVVRPSGQRLALLLAALLVAQVAVVEPVPARAAEPSPGPIAEPVPAEPATDELVAERTEFSRTYALPDGEPTSSAWSAISDRVAPFNRKARALLEGNGLTAQPYLAHVWTVNADYSPAWCFGNPCTYGQYIFPKTPYPRAGLMSREYIHVLQFEGRGWDFFFNSLVAGIPLSGSGPSNPEDAVAYVWEVWTANLGPWEAEPWEIWRRPTLAGGIG
jgi:hypothetical protein